MPAFRLPNNSVRRQNWVSKACPNHELGCRQNSTFQRGGQGAIFRIVGLSHRTGNHIAVNQCERWLLILGCPGDLPFLGSARTHPNAVTDPASLSAAPGQGRAPELTGITQRRDAVPRESRPENRAGCGGCGGVQRSRRTVGADRRRPGRDRSDCGRATFPWVRQI